MAHLLQPEEPAWSLALAATTTGVDLVLAVPTAAGMSIRIALDRDEARLLARGLLAAAGDATERTFPHPKILEP